MKLLWKLFFFCLCISLFSFSATLATLSIDYSFLKNSPQVEEWVKKILDWDSTHVDQSILWTISKTVGQSQQRLINEFDWEVILTTTPSNEHEELSKLVDSLSQYLCEKKQVVIGQFDQEEYYTPTLPKDIIVWTGECYNDGRMLHQEWIRYYTLPGIGTMQVMPLSLIKSLWYKTSDIERYLKRDGIAYERASDQFFFDWITGDEIIPLLNLTSSLQHKKTWNRSFDQFKVVAYSTTNNYPFMNSDIMVSVFAKKWDNLIKITTPYGKYYHNTLDTVVSSVKKVFIYSIEKDLRESILAFSTFHSAYQQLMKDSPIAQDILTENLVHYYLSLLWKNDEQPEKFVRAMMWLVTKDRVLLQELQSWLAQLEVFL